ncbi:MAG: class I SAM-dependent methyltransferase [Burkholderiales bacterium]|nr:class I SAM-dependent methyltransferase [Burkholderiales bacterium]
MPTTARVLMAILERIQTGSIELILPDGSTRRFIGREPGPQALLRLGDWGVCSEILRSGDIGFAEAFIDGRWDSPDLTRLLTVAAINHQALNAAIHGRWWGWIAYRLKHLLRTNTRTQARRNIHAHYDLGNAFYQLWLDATMTYSSALFEGQIDRSLDAAQTAKYERILQVLGVTRGARILEIGCGWGGFAEHAIRTRECSVHGLTLSTEQLAFARERHERAGLSGKSRFELLDYRDAVGQYDYVVSIEMFEAVGERYWPAYFRTVHDRLMPGGRALIQTITIDDMLFPRYRIGTDFIQQFIFPGGMLPSPSVFRTLAQEAGLQEERCIAFGPDYAETLRRWRTAFNAHLPELDALGFDDRFVRLWNFYLAYCEAGFTAGTINVMQAELRRA